MIAAAFRSREAQLASFDQFRQELLAQMELAASGGANHVHINSNQLHFVIGIVPLRVSEALCRDVMQKEMKSAIRCWRCWSGCRRGEHPVLTAARRRKLKSN
jgi:hypothetical protein